MSSERPRRFQRPELNLDDDADVTAGMPSTPVRPAQVPAEIDSAPDDADSSTEGRRRGARTWQTRAERAAGAEAPEVQQGRDLAALQRERDHAARRSRPKFEREREAQRRAEHGRRDRRARAAYVRWWTLRVVGSRKLHLVLAATIIAAALTVIAPQARDVIDPPLSAEELDRDLPQLQVRAVGELRAARVGKAKVTEHPDSFAVTFRVRAGEPLAKGQGRAERDCYVRFRVDRRASTDEQLNFQLDGRRLCRAAG